MRYILAIVTFFIFSSTVSALTGSILPSFRTASFTDGGLVNTGNFSFVPSRNVTVSDTELTGFFWGETTGWINLNCINTNSCANSNYRVANTGYGVLSGFAWGETTGWINFGPFQNTTTPSVVINAQGEFNGYAWAENMGWLTFSCNPLDATYPDSCTKTTWIPIPARPACSNTLDDDGDGLIDYPADGGCISATDTDESGPFPVPPFLLPQPPFFDILPPLIPEIPPLPEVNVPIPPQTVIPPVTLLPRTPFPEPPFIFSPGRVAPSIPIGFSITFPSLNTQVISYLERGYAYMISIAREVLQFSLITNSLILIGLLPTLFRGVSTLFFLQPITVREIMLLPKRIHLHWHPRDSWGGVYDARNGAPLDPAFIQLVDTEGVEKATTVTNKKGQFGFTTIPDGTYRLIVYKNGYTFPSTHEGYHGEFITVSRGTAQIPDIPLDVKQFSQKGYMRNILFLIGLSVSVLAHSVQPTVFSTGTLVLYGMTYLFERSILAKK